MEYHADVYVPGLPAKSLTGESREAGARRKQGEGLIHRLEERIQEQRHGDIARHGYDNGGQPEFAANDELAEYRGYYSQQVKSACASRLEIWRCLCRWLHVDEILSEIQEPEAESSKFLMSSG